MIEFTAEPDTILRAIEANNDTERPQTYSPPAWNHEKQRITNILIAVLMKAGNGSYRGPFRVIIGE